MKQSALFALCVSTLLLGAACSSGSIPGAPPVTTPPAANKDAAPATTPPSTPPGENPPPPAATPDAAATPPVTGPVETADAAPVTVTTDGGAVVVTPPSGAGPKGPYTCTVVLGISATGDWFKAGFEKIVDGDRWELMSIHNAFVNNWADPNDALWKNKPSSPCTMNADNPDRIIIESLYLHWMDATVEEWVTVLEKFVATAKAKFSNLRNVELSAFVRSPTDMPCPGNMPFKSFIRPEQDMADAMMLAKHPDIVTVAPVIRVDSCGDYNGNPPHFTNGASAAKIGAKVGAVYKDRQ